MRPPAARLASVAVLGLSVLGLHPIPIAPSDRLLPADDAKVRAVEAAYAAAWVKNDPAAILATLWPDAVLMPAGRAPIRGVEEIRRFWWPPGGPRTTVTVFDSRVAQIGGSRATAWVVGTYRFDFWWESGGKRTERRNRGNTLMVFRKSEAGEWRISHRMWSDLPP
jgi:uncharacterized protein (TIGR02246 family)